MGGAAIWTAPLRYFRLGCEFVSVCDDRLVRDALAGQQDAYAGLLQRYERLVFSLIMRLVRDPGVAEELAQETFLKAFRRLDTFDRQRGFSAWLLRIAHNTAIDALRRRGPEIGWFVTRWRVSRTPTPGCSSARHLRSARGFSAWLLRIAHNTAIDALRRRGPETLAIDAGPGGAARVVAASDLGPDRQTADRLLVRDLAAALAGLRPEHRLALVLRFQEAQPYKQIAYVMGVSEGTAKSYVHRARRRLADEMRTAGWGGATDRPGSRST